MVPKPKCPGWCCPCPWIVFRTVKETVIFTVVCCALAVFIFRVLCEPRIMATLENFYLLDWALVAVFAVGLLWLEQIHTERRFEAIGIVPRRKKKKGTLIVKEEDYED